MFSSRRRIVKADPLMSIGSTNKDATIDQLRAEARLLDGMALSRAEVRRRSITRSAADRAQAVVDRYSRERCVDVGKHRESIVEYVALLIDALSTNPPSWVSSDEAIFDHIDQLMPVRFKDS